MHNGLVQVGAWLISLSIVLGPWLSPQMIAAASPQTNQATAPNFTVHTTNPVILNEIGVNTTQEFIELYNRQADSIALDGWTVTEQTASGTERVAHTFATPTELAGYELVTISLANRLNNDQDIVNLKNAAGEIVDQLAYGLRTTDDIAAPATGTSIARSTNGQYAWYTNVPPTQNATNLIDAIPPQVTNLSIPKAETHPENTINFQNKDRVEAQVMVAQPWSTNGHLTLEAIDHLGTTKQLQKDVPAGQTSSLVGPLDTTTLPALVDGNITLRASTSNVDGVRTSYQLAHVTRDTQAPNQPQSVTIPASQSNSANVINGANAANITTLVTLPSTSQTTDEIIVEISDGERTVIKTAPATAGGGTVNVQETAGIFVVHGIDSSSLRDGQIVVKASLKDAAGNQSSKLIGVHATKDTQSPQITPSINQGATVTNTTESTLTLRAQDIGSGIDRIRVSNQSDLADATWLSWPAGDQEFTISWWLPQGEGRKIVYAQAQDKAGNLSPVAQDEIILEHEVTNIKTIPLAMGEQTIREMPIEVTLAAQGETILTLAQYTENPGSTLPRGLTRVGAIPEIGLDKSDTINFPILVKIYYTLEDLRDAGVTNEEQLRGIAFYNRETGQWQFYTTTGVVTEDITINGQTYAGYFYATADHLTPMAGFADITPPPTPENPTLTATMGEIQLSWTAVDEASEYIIRYRLANAQAPFTAVTVPAGTTTVRITNLDPNQLYEVGLASRDVFGNTSAFTTSLIYPRPPEVKPEQVTGQTSTDKPLRGPTVLAPGTITPRNTGNGLLPNPPDTPTDDHDGQVLPDRDEQIDSGDITPEGSQAEQRARDLSRILIALAIVIIAIGAGTAGYYGYQWWATRTAPSPGTQTPTTTPKSTAIPPTEPTHQPPEKPIPPKKPPQEGRW